MKTTLKRLQIVFFGLVLIVAGCGKDDEAKPALVANGEADVTVDSENFTSDKIVASLIDGGEEGKFLSITIFLENSAEHQVSILYSVDFSTLQEGINYSSYLGYLMGTYNNLDAKVQATGTNARLSFTEIDRTNGMMSGSFSLALTNLNASIDEIVSGVSEISVSGTFTDVSYQDE